jgi:hypothetical protein
MQKLSIIALCCLGLVLSVNAVQFGKKNSQTQIKWHYKNQAFHFNIQAAGLAIHQPKKTDDEIKTSYGLILENEKYTAAKDSVCLAFDINNDGETFYNLLIDYEGNVKGIYTNILDWQEPWQVDLKATVKQQKGTWSATISIPASLFHCQPGTGDIWKIAFGRRFIDKGKIKYSFSEKDTFRLSYGPSLSRNGWKQLPLPNQKIILNQTKNKKFNVSCRTHGACDINSPQENIANFTINSAAQAVKNGTIEVLDDQNMVLIKLDIKCLPNQLNNFLIPYKLSATKKVSFKIEIDNKSVYQATYPVRNRLACRVAVINNSKPFMVDKNKIRPVPGYNGMTWSQLEGNNRAAWFADNFGFPWKRGEWFERCSAEKLLPWMINTRKINHYNNTEKHIKEIRKHKTKIAITPQYWEYQKKQWLARNMYGGYMVDPVDYKNYFKQLNKSLTTYKGEVAAFFMRDESYMQARKRTVKLYEYHKKTGLYPFIETVNQEIKEKFGYGKYGIPLSTKDKNRFRWIALKRWAVDFNEKFEKKTIAAIRKINKNVPIMSPDLVGDMVSADISRWRDGRFDIYLTQLNNHRRANAFNGVVQCRIFKDLTQAKEIWGCTHIEDSAAKFSLEEMRLNLSYFVQNGMTGMHTWPLGGRKPWMLDSSVSRPEIWQYFVETAATLANGIKVPQPAAPQIAIYLSELSQMSIPGYWDWVGFVEPAFVVLGPELKTNFKFISDLSVTRKLDNPQDYKLIIAPFLQFTNQESATQLLNAVKNGATLLISDPQAFSHLADGSVPVKIQQAFFGKTKITATAKQMATASNEQVDFLAGINIKMTIPPPTLLKIVGKTYTFKTDDSAQVLMRYADKSPAAIIRKLGKGKVIVTGFNIYSLTSNQPASWNSVEAPTLQFFRALLKSNKVDEKIAIWNFKLPPAKRQSFKENICISNNSMEFRQAIPKTLLNADIGMLYTYSQFPDLKQDVKQQGWISVDNGKLTDRFEVMFKNRNKPNVVAWKQTRPVEITVDLRGKRDIAEVIIYVARQNPDVQLSGSQDGKTFTPVQKHRGNDTKTHVEKIALKDLSGQWNYLKIKISPKQALKLIEMEIWEK